MPTWFASGSLRIRYTSIRIHNRRNPNRYLYPRLFVFKSKSDKKYENKYNVDSISLPRREPKSAIARWSRCWQSGTHAPDELRTTGPTLGRYPTFRTLPTVPTIITMGRLLVYEIFSSISFFFPFYFFVSYLTCGYLQSLAIWLIKFICFWKKILERVICTKLCRISCVHKFTMMLLVQIIYKSSIRKIMLRNFHYNFTVKLGWHYCHVMWTREVILQNYKNKLYLKILFETSLS